MTKRNKIWAVIITTAVSALVTLWCLTDVPTRVWFKENIHPFFLTLWVVWTATWMVCAPMMCAAISDEPDEH